MSDPTTPAHQFVRPGQAGPELAPPDNCMRCGGSEASHRQSTYIDEAMKADLFLDEQLAMLRREEDAGEITTYEAAAERVAALTKHLDEVRHLRIKYFGGSQS